MKAPEVALILSFFLLFASPVYGGGQSNSAMGANTTQTASDSSIRAADTAFHEGYAAAERNDLEAARVSFEKAVQLAPAVAAGHSALGAVLLALGDSSGAVRELEAAQRLDHMDRSTLLNLCVAYSNSHLYAKAIASFHMLEDGVPAADALPPDAAIAIATAYSETNGADAAQAVLQRALDAAIAAGQDDARLHNALGTILAQKKAYPEAETHFRRALALDDTLAAAHYHLGAVELDTERVPDAVIELAKAYALEPKSVGYGLELSRAWVADRQEAKAIELLRQILAGLNPSTSAQAVEVKYQLALALQSSGDARQSIPFFSDVLKARPDDAEVLTNAGLAQVQIGDAKDGVSLYLRALKLTPNNETLREDLGVAYLQQADLDHALEQFRAGVALDDANPQLHYDLGLAMKLKDDLTGAIPEFQRAAELDPQLPDPPYTLGIIFMQQGQFEKSAASLEKATTLQPGNGEAWALLGSVYQQMQLPEKAVPALRQAIALMPQQPSPHITLAAILAAQGHKDEAAAERKLGASLTRAVVNRQKANFGLDSGNLLMKRGQTQDALVQFQSAVEADPGYAAPHIALAAALDRAGRKAEAAEERRKAAELNAAGTTKSP